MEPNEFEEPTAVEGEVAEEAPPEPVEGDEVQEAPIDTGDSKEEEGRLGYRLPGQEDQTERQLRWYQENYANALSSLEAYRQKLDEMELSDLTDEERQYVKTQREVETLRQQVEAVQREKATGQWRGYYQQFAPADVDLSSTDNPIEMQHATLTALAETNQTLAKEVKALKESLSKQKKGAPVSNKAAAPPPSGGLWSLDQTPEQMEETFRRAKLGLI